MRTITILFALWAMFYGTKTANVCTKQRCDFLKALLPFLIILCHFCHPDWPWPFGGDFYINGTPVVMIFFFISGYGLNYKRSRGGIQLRELPSRLWKLLTPTIIPSIIYLILLFLLGENAFSYLWDCITSFSCPLPYSWFVAVLALLYIGYYVCNWISKKLFLLLIFLYIVAVVCIYKYAGNRDILYISDFSLLVGCIYNKYETKILSILNNKGIMKFAIAVLAMFSAFATYYLQFHSSNEWLLSFVRYSWLLFFLMTFSLVNIFQHKIIDFFTKISYDIYLCQGFAFGIIPYKEWNLAVSLVAIVTLTIIIATFSHWAHQKVFKGK